MKKIIIGFFVLSLLFINTNQAKASLVDDLLNQIQSLRTELSLLRAQQGASVLGATADTTPRIMYWSGKVNQHIDSNGVWQTDPNGFSGANIDKLTYCKKWFPNTVSVEDYLNETITTWRAAGNVGSYTSTKMSTKCVQGGTLTPSITVTYPNGGETFNAGDKISVKWSHSNVPEDSVICLYLESSFYSNNISCGDFVTNSFMSSVTLPKTLNNSNYELRGNFKIKIVVTNRLSSDPYLHIEDSSNNTFEILSSSTIGLIPEVNLPYPTAITSNSANLGAKTIISPTLVSERGICYGLQNNNLSFGVSGVTCITATQNNFLSSGGEFIVPVTSLTPNTKYYFKAYAKNEKGIGYSAVSYFMTSSVSTPSITVTSPNGGEEFVQGELNKIYWIGGKEKVQVGLANKNDTINQTNPSVIGWIKVDAEPNSNIKWDGVSLTDLTGTANWTITPGEYKIIVVSKTEIGNYCFGTQSFGADVCNFDLSDTFTIKPSTATIPSITVLSPKGGENFISGQQITVNWKSNNIVAGIVGIILEDSNNSIKLNVYPTLNDGNEIITLPNISGNNFRVFITNDQTGGAYSNYFSINKDPGCSLGQIYSEATGLKCPSTTAPVIADGCLPGYVFSPTTGKQCSASSISGGGTSTSNTPVNICSASVLVQKLGIGMSGNQVRSLQATLNSLGYLDDNGIDGNFGRGTRSAVMAFQMKNGLTVDGIVGASTRRALNAQWQAKCSGAVGTQSRISF